MRSETPTRSVRGRAARRRVRPSAPTLASPPRHRRAPRPPRRAASARLAATALWLLGGGPVVAQAAPADPVETRPPAALGRPATPVTSGASGGHAPTLSPTEIERALGRAVPRMHGWRGAPGLRSAEAVRALYRHRGYRPVWSAPETVAMLRAALADARADGVVAIDAGGPDGVDPDALDPFTAAPHGTPDADAAAREVRLTDLLLTLLERLPAGTTDPGPVAPPADDGGAVDARDGADRSAPRARDLARLSLRLDAGDVAGAVAAARPATPLYTGLRDALARHLEALAGDGLPPPIGAGPTLEPGSAAGARTERLRRRLAALDTLDGLRGADRRVATRLVPPGALAGAPGEAFGPALEAAVRAFQTRHGLEADGLVGRLTRAAIDAPLESRIDRLRVNLERARHIARALGDEDRVVVNVADQRLTLELDGERAWETDVVVGQRKHRTPVHVDRIEYLELDPRWTVPRKIVLDTLYARAKADPAAFANEGFVLKDLAGRWRDPREVDWEGMTPERFHYDVIQRPGPRNPLGRAKFMFPNRYAVYLHDTPERDLFELERRAFSRGCVRVKDADTLAALLLEHRNGVDKPDIVTLRAVGDEVKIDLERPLTVALLYWTAEVDENGWLRSIGDLYGRDGTMSRALAEGVS